MRAQMEFSGKTYTHAHLLNENMYAHFCLSHFFSVAVHNPVVTLLTTFQRFFFLLSGLFSCL